MGLKESTVMQWSARGKWLADVGKPKQLPPSSMQAQVVSNVSTPAEALADSLADMSAGTRLNLARALLNGSAHAARLDGAEVLDKAVPLGHLTRSASSVHAWAETRGEPLVRINVLLDDPFIVRSVEREVRDV
jgi:hypothetical protein